MADDDNDRPVEVRSLYGVKTQQGLVELKIGDHATMMSIRNAKEIHSMLGEAIEASVTDEVLVKWLVSRLGFPLEKAAMVLMDFREIRQGSKNIVKVN